MTAVRLESSNPANGCEVCGSSDTTWLSAYTGRRCDEHRPVFDPTTAAKVATTDPDAARAYVTAEWPGEESA